MYFNVQGEEQDILQFLFPFDPYVLPHPVPVPSAPSQEASSWPAYTGNTKARIIDGLGQAEHEWVLPASWLAGSIYPHPPLFPQQTSQSTQLLGSEREAQIFWMPGWQSQWGRVLKWSHESLQLLRDCSKVFCVEIWMWFGKPFCVGKSQEIRKLEMICVGVSVHECASIF